MGFEAEVEESLGRSDWGCIVTKVFVFVLHKLK